MMEKLKNLREAKKLTQKQFAPKVAMDQSSYSKKENGKTKITDEEWERFAKALETNVEEIKENKSIQNINNNNTFNENSINFGIQNINIPKEALDIILKYTKKLEEDLENLRKE